MGQLDCVRRAQDQAFACVDWYITTQLTVQVRVWSGSQVGDGVESVESELVLAKRYTIEEASLRLVHASGGLYQAGDVRVGPVTPPFAEGAVTGGYGQEALDPQRGLGIHERRRRVLYVLEGDIRGDFVLIDMDVSDPTGWMLTLRRTRRAAPATALARQLRNAGGEPLTNSAGEALLGAA